MCAIPMLPFISFVYKRQITEHTIFLVVENIFHCGLDGTMMLYTITPCFVIKTENGRAISAYCTFNTLCGNAVNELQRQRPTSPPDNLRNLTETIFLF